MSNDSVKVLRRTKSLLRKGWTQGPEAKSSSGRAVRPESPRACKWCLWGAVLRAQYDLSADNDTYAKAWTALYNVLGESPVCFNEYEGRKKFEILAIVDAAIEYLDGR